MNKGLILLVALWAFIAIANARPLLLVADQTDAPLGISNGWSGVAYAWVTQKKGQHNSRLRVFGASQISETLTGAWLQFKNGTLIDNLAFSPNSSSHYVLGDLRINDTILEALTHEEVYITTASSSHRNGSITGAFTCRPHTGIVVADASQVVGASSSSEKVGLGWVQIDVGSIFALPQDVLEQDAEIISSSLFNGRLIHDSDNATAITFHAPANTSETASSLSSATIGTHVGRWAGVTVDDDFYSIDTGDSYVQVTDSVNGDIRGQVYPLLMPTRRAIPLSVDTINGNTVVPSGGFRTLRFGNQEGNENNKNSYISLRSVANPTNYTYLGLFTFKSATNKKNFELVRALTLEMNARISGAGTWLFEFFDSTTGEFLPFGTISSADTWTPAYIDNWSFDVDQYADNRKTLVIRVSVNSATQTTLDLDLFGIRSWVANSFTNQAIKTVVKIANTYPAKFANGTVINQ